MRPRIALLALLAFAPLVLWASLPLVADAGKSERIGAKISQAGRPDLVTVILNSKGFADLLERSEFMRRINEQDAQVITAVREAKIRTKRATDHLAKLEDRQQRITEQVLAARNEVAGVKY